MGLLRGELVVLGHGAVDTAQVAVVEAVNIKYTGLFTSLNQALFELGVHTKAFFCNK